MSRPKGTVCSVVADLVLGSPIAGTMAHSHDGVGPGYCERPSLCVGNSARHSQEGPGAPLEFFRGRQALPGGAEITISLANSM